MGLDQKSNTSPNCGHHDDYFTRAAAYKASHPYHWQLATETTTLQPARSKHQGCCEGEQDVAGTAPQPRRRHKVEPCLPGLVLVDRSTRPPVEHPGYCGPEQNAAAKALQIGRSCNAKSSTHADCSPPTHQKGDLVGAVVDTLSATLGPACMRPLTKDLGYVVVRNAPLNLISCPLWLPMRLPPFCPHRGQEVTVL